MTRTVYAITKYEYEEQPSELFTTREAAVAYLIERGYVMVPGKTDLYRHPNKPYEWDQYYIDDYSLHGEFE